MMKIILIFFCFNIFSIPFYAQEIDDEYLEAINYFKSNEDIYGIIVEKWNLNISQRLKLKRKYFKNGIFQFNIHKNIYALPIYEGHLKKIKNINIDSIRKKRDYITFLDSKYHQYLATDTSSNYTIFLSEKIGTILIAELQISKNINYNYRDSDYKRVNFMFEFYENKRIKEVSYLTIIP